MPKWPITNRPLGQAEQGHKQEAVTLSAPHPRTWALGGGAGATLQGARSPVDAGARRCGGSLSQLPTPAPPLRSQRARKAGGHQSAGACGAAAAPRLASPSPNSPLPLSGPSARGRRAVTGRRGRTASRRLPLLAPRSPSQVLGSQRSLGSAYRPKRRGPPPLSAYARGSGRLRTLFGTS